MEIREIKKDEMKSAIDLIWKTFLEYEAPDYTEEGIEEFKGTKYIISIPVIQENKNEEQ